MGRAELITEITEEMLLKSPADQALLTFVRQLGLKSYIGVPLKVRGTTIGMITFVTAESGHLYDETDLAVTQDLADRGGIAMENNRLYRELRDTDRRKDEFLATLAHELRNPLSPIKNSLEILKMPRVDAATSQQVRGLMERQVHHLVRLVDDLLDVARVMRGKIELRKERIELATIIARAVETAKPIIEFQQHQSKCSSLQTRCLDADPVRLVQVIGNLLTNAAKYSEQNGQITIGAWQEGDRAVLSIRDTGIGIAPDMLPHVFELFVQADHASSKTQGGLGIGLTLVKSLVEMHGGSVDAKSEGLGKGSEFIIRVPLSVRVQEAHREEAAMTATTAGQRVMVVDDNRDAAITLSTLLSLWGHTVEVANDGVTALSIAKVFRPDTIFLDIGMPVMDGYEVARRIRATPELEKTVLAALTGWGQERDRKQSSEAGFNYHLVKPPDLETLNRVLETHH